MILKAIYILGVAVNTSLLAAHAQTITITEAPAIPTDEPSYTDEATFTSAILNSTNFYRQEHNASAVVWNTTLEDYAAQYLNSTCKFAHSGGPYGENLAEGYPNATLSVDAWGDEQSQYDYSNPDFSEATGHFTQLVWKATTDVGCGRRLCGESWYLVCEYWPRGNVIGEFADEVGGLINVGNCLRPDWTSIGLVIVVALIWSG